MERNDKLVSKELLPLLTNKLYQQSRQIDLLFSEIGWLRKRLFLLLGVMTGLLGVAIINLLKI